MVLSSSITTRRAVRSALPKENKTNKPLRKVYKRYKGRKKTVQNAAAVRLLGKQVKTLQLQRYGFRQYQTQFVNMTSATPLNFPNMEAPIAFMLNNFYNGTALFRGGISAAVPPFANPFPVGVPLGITWQKQTFNATFGNQWQWNAQNNQELVSQSHYLPVATRLSILFRSRVQAAQREPIRFRISVIKVRDQVAGRSALQSGHPLALPDSLGAYRGLAADFPQDRNYFASKLHKVLYDKWIVFNPPEQGATSLDKTWNYTHKFPLLDFAKDNAHAQPGGVTAYNSIPSNQQVWLIMSCNTGNLFSSDAAMDIFMSRTNVWRDQKGVTII